MSRMMSDDAEKGPTIPLPGGLRTEKRPHELQSGNGDGGQGGGSNGNSRSSNPGKMQILSLDTIVSSSPTSHSGSVYEGQNSNHYTYLK